MDSRKFEDSWKDAFEKAELAPTENVWTNIELDLEKADGNKVRRRLVFYKMLAAASVAFALGLTGVGYYIVQTQGQTEGIAVKVPSHSDVPTQNDVAEASQGASGKKIARTTDDAAQGDDAGDRALENPTDNAFNSPAYPGIRDGIAQAGSSSKDSNIIKGTPRAEKANTDQAILDVSRAGGDFSQQANANVPASEAGAFLSRPEGYTEEGNVVGSAFLPTVQRELPPFYALKAPTLDLNEPEPDLGALLLARLAQEEMAYAALDKKAEKDKSERLWTSVGFSAGGFSAVNAATSTPPVNGFMSSNNSTVPDKQAKASGFAYSFGLNVGAKLAKRWVLMGGVNYLTQSSDYTATNVVGDSDFKTLKAESINALDKLSGAGYSTSRLAPTFPYSVNNNVQFFSVPVQAGYLLVDNRFGLQLNAGVSTDLFLQNTITPEGVSLDKTTQGSGADSPYRTVNFSGLVGTELTYRFGHRYRIALNPGVRYPFSSVYKSDIGIQSTPLTFDVGLRFRYIFH